MIFPNLKNKTFGYLNLNIESVSWCNTNKIDSESKNILLDPVVCQKFITDTHKKYSLDFSYGGWMENRTNFLRESYLEEGDKFIHLGIDINVPTGTEIATDFDAEVIKTGDDLEPNLGWGPHVILKHLSKPVYIIYGHLDKKILCSQGDILKINTIFAKVGFPPDNGNWFPHVHVQCINPEYFSETEGKIENLDGYGYQNEMELNANRHKDPMEFISLNF